MSYLTATTSLNIDPTKTTLPKIKLFFYSYKILTSNSMNLKVYSNKESIQYSLRY